MYFVKYFMQVCCHCLPLVITLKDSWFLLDMKGDFDIIFCDLLRCRVNWVDNVYLCVHHFVDYSMFISSIVKHVFVCWLINNILIICRILLAWRCVIILSTNSYTLYYIAVFYADNSKRKIFGAYFVNILAWQQIYLF